MKTVRRALPWLALGVIAALLWFSWPAGHRAISQSNAARDSPGNARGGVPAENSRVFPDAPPVSSDPAVSRLIEDCMARFLASSGARESTDILNELREQIRAADPAAAAASIARFLASGQDAPTKLPFVVGAQGVLETSPTLRTALLDLLPSLDPDAALELARAVMNLKNSPEEYALALRNLAWNDLDGDLNSEISDRLKQMIEMKDWREHPSAGFLEALDAAIVVSGDQSFEMLLGLHASASVGRNVGLQRAAFVALDRMAASAPDMLARTYSQDPTLQGVSPDLRASMMSRLDINVPAQGEVFLRYVSDAGIDAKELDYFSGLFPNGNSLHGNWLISSDEPPLSIQARLEADRRTLAALDRMDVNNLSERSIQAIDGIRGRLKQVIQNAAPKED